MKTRTRRNFNAEFRLCSGQLLVDQGRSVREAAETVGVGHSTMDKWVRQLRQERQGKSPKSAPMTPEQVRIRELERELKRLKEDNDILKKASALLMSDRLNDSR